MSQGKAWQVKEAAWKAYQALEAGRNPCLGRCRRHGWEGREAYCVGNACRQGKVSRQGGMAILAVGDCGSQAGLSR